MRMDAMGTDNGSFLSIGRIQRGLEPPIETENNRYYLRDDRKPTLKFIGLTTMIAKKHICNTDSPQCQYRELRFALVPAALALWAVCVANVFFCYHRG